jgi:hypothetical protein
MIYGGTAFALAMLALSAPLAWLGLHEWLHDSPFIAKWKTINGILAVVSLIPPVGLTAVLLVTWAWTSVFGGSIDAIHGLWGGLTYLAFLAAPWVIERSTRRRRTTRPRKLTTPAGKAARERPTWGERISRAPDMRKAYPPARSPRLSDRRGPYR